MRINNMSTPETLGEYFADIVCNNYNQHAIIRIVGLAGTGKSWAAIDLGIEISRCIAEKISGTPEQYYSFENDLGVMGRDEIERVMKNPGKYHVLHLDDVGVAWNARHFNDEFNIDLNDIIQTFRPNNNIVIMTMQSGFLVDKVPRSIAHYEIEMEQANFREGYTIAKVQQLVLKHKKGKVHYPYLFLNGSKYKRHIFETPPKEWTDRYEAERAKQLKRVGELKEKEKKLKIMEQEYKTEIKQLRINERLQKINKHNSPKRETIKEKAQKLHDDWVGGKYKGRKFKDLCEENGLNYLSAKASLSN